MEFTAQKEQVLGPLQALMGVVERKKTFPILDNVLLTVEGALLSILGTDLEVELITYGVSLETQHPGVIAVPAKKWGDVLRTLPDESAVQYRLENNKLQIRAENARFSLNTRSAQDFPRMENVHGTTEFEIAENILLGLLKKTTFSMGEQDVRHYLNGLFLEVKPKGIKIVAADGHRLSLAEAHWLVPGIDAQVILPRRAVLELVRLLQDKTQNALVQIGPNYVQIKTQTLTFACKLIDAKFPPYQSIIPKATQKTVLLERDVFKQALQRVTALSTEKDHGVCFKLEKDQVLMCSTNPVHEGAEVIVPVDYTGEACEIGFNGHYLLDILQVMQTAYIELSLPLPGQSIRIEEHNNPDCLYIVMPVYL